jgi:RNA-directed DNA polymerase
MADRCQQELFKILMLPEWDAKFDLNSFGFNSGRTCYDALYRLRNFLSDNYMNSFTIDISKCVFLLKSGLLLSKINFVGFCRFQIQMWLKFFYLGDFSLYQISYSHFQGRSVYILMINIILYGIHLKLNIDLQNSPLFKFFHFLNYFTTFLVINRSWRLLFNFRISILKFLGQAQVRVFKIKCSINRNKLKNLGNFDFLGFTVKQFRLKNNFHFNKLKGYNTFFYPSAKNIFLHHQYLRYLVLKRGRMFKQDILIDKLNLVIKAWVHYFGNFDSNLTGHIVKQDYLLYLKLRRWVKRKKGSVKRGLSYWQSFGSNNWVFMTMDRSSILKYHLHYI